MKHGDDGLDQTTLAPSTHDSEPEADVGLAVTVAGDSDDSQRAKSAGLSSSSVDRQADMSRFMIIDTLGSGGMSVVFSAYDPELDRKLAIKVLRPDVWQGRAVAQGRRRLMREAQAMGKLSHPHVITVYEVGHAEDGGVFIAMEYIDGGTLGDWMKTRRSWRQVVSVFAKAGRGLAAAHRAGLVHRDFKPDNVLIGKDGRVRVTDFGLVASVRSDDPIEPLDDANLSPTPHLDSQLTRAGAVLGTPRYMAPEQHLDANVDARADQFSFCIALYQAVYGKLPYEAKDYRSLRRAVIDGDLRPPPRGQVPKHLARILSRGLATDPDQRYPNMDELIRDLEYDPMVARRRAIAGVPVACLGAVALYGFSREPTSATAEQCPVPDHRFAGVWDDQVKQRMRERFDGTNASFARKSFDRASRLLDDYRQRWASARVDTCRATKVRGEQSPALLDRRMACLDRRLGELDALTTLLSRSADSAMVARSAEAIYGLPDVQQCASVTLSVAHPLPHDSARRQKIIALQDELSEAQALRLAGRIPQGLQKAGRVASTSKVVSYPPLRADVLLELGRAQRLAGKPTLAGPTLSAAVDAAAAAKNDTAVARAWLELMYVRGYLQARDREAMVVGASARAAIIRSGGNPDLEASLLSTMGVMLKLQGKLDAAEDHYKRAVALIERTHGKHHFSLTAPLHNLGLLYIARRNPARAEAAFRRDLEVTTKAFGASHPETAGAITGIASVLSRQRKFAEAEAYYRRALRIRQHALGDDNPRVAQALNNVGAILRRRGNYDEAVGYHKRALAMWRKALGNDHPNTARPLVSLALLAKKQKRYDDAERHYKAVAALYKAARGTKTRQYLLTVRRLAWLAIDRGNHREGLAYCKRSYRGERARNASPRTIVSSLECLAEALLGLGDKKAARTHLEDAMARARAHDLGTKATKRISALLAKTR